MTELNPILPCLSHLTQRDAAIFMRAFRTVVDCAFDRAKWIAADAVPIFNATDDQEEGARKQRNFTLTKLINAAPSILEELARTSPMEERGLATAPSDATRETPDVAVLAGGESIASIDMLLWCPRCHRQHIDAPDGDWANPPHRSHLCGGCGCVWRPADVATNGVARIETSSAKDTWSPSVETEPLHPFEGTRVTDPPFTARHADLLDFLACEMWNSMEEVGRGVDADLIEGKRLAAFPAEVKPT